MTNIKFCICSDKIFKDNYEELFKKYLSYQYLFGQVNSFFVLLIFFNPQMFSHRNKSWYDNDLKLGDTIYHNLL